MAEFKKKNLFTILDILCSEYHWSLEYCLRLPNDAVINLISVIQDRKLQQMKMWTKLIGAACSAGFNGKLDKLDNIFKEPQLDTPQIDDLAWKGQVKSLWLRMKTKGKKDVKKEDYDKLVQEFEKMWASGEAISF